jgi:predicted transcriptional regulator
MELAESLKTTSANISQQLRLLELAGLVKSEKTRESDKKKPRVMYALADDYSYVVMCTQRLASKKLLPLSTYHNFILKSMLFENYEDHKYLGQLYHVLHEYLNSLDLVAVDNTSEKLSVLVVGERKTLSNVEKSLAKTELSSFISFKLIQKSEYKQREGLLVLHEVR